MTAVTTQMMTTTELLTDSNEAISHKFTRVTVVASFPRSHSTVIGAMGNIAGVRHGRCHCYDSRILIITRDDDGFIPIVISATLCKQTNKTNEPNKGKLLKIQNANKNDEFRWKIVQINMERRKHRKGRMEVKIDTWMYRVSTIRHDRQQWINQIDQPDLNGWLYKWVFAFSQQRGDKTISRTADASISIYSLFIKIIGHFSEWLNYGE